MDQQYRSELMAHLDQVYGQCNIFESIIKEQVSKQSQQPQFSLNHLSKYLIRNRLVQEGDYITTRVAYMTKVKDNGQYHVLLKYTIGFEVKVDKIVIWNSTISLQFFRTLSFGLDAFQSLEIMACDFVGGRKYRVKGPLFMHIQVLTLNSLPIGNAFLASLLSQMEFFVVNRLTISNTSITNDCLKLIIGYRLNLQTLILTHHDKMYSSIVLKCAMAMKKPYGIFPKTLYLRITPLQKNRGQHFAYLGYISKINLDLRSNHTIQIQDTQKSLAQWERAMMVSQRTTDVLRKGGFRYAGVE